MAKGLLINITGGKDLTLFEVDQTVQKVRAEVDPEAELIFGAIKDETMDGKMRVSIVATALDGHKSQTNTVLNMVSRIQNRNNGYSDGLFSNNANMENNTLTSIDGATALKLNEEYEINEQKENSTINNFAESVPEPEIKSSTVETETENVLPGVSIESASYMENNSTDELNIQNEGINLSNDFDDQEEYTPKLFSDGNKLEVQNNEAENFVDSNEKLFDQDLNEEEDFEIPAFLRKQKF